MNLFNCFRHSRGPRLRRQAFLAIFLLSAAVLAGCSGSAGVPDGAANRSIGDICSQAQALVDKGQPQQAVDLVEATRKKYLVPAGTASPSPADPAQFYCQQVYTNANYMLAENLSREAAPENFPQSWLETKEIWAAPPIGWGLSIAVGWLAGALVAAMLARIKFFEREKVSTKRPGRYGFAGHVLLLAGVTASATFISRAAIGRPGPVLLLVLFLFPVAAAIVFLAYALANRVALQISVRNSDGAIDQAKTSNLLVLIRKLGYKQSYKGIPALTDSQNNILANSTVQGTPENRIMAFLQFIFTTVFGVHPWRVYIDETADGFLIVIINRNGRSKASERISASAVHEYTVVEGRQSAPTPGIRSYKMAAALISTTLSQDYKDFDDLCGATQWRSIGLVYAAVGVTENVDHHYLLKNAAILDPENLTAQLQLQTFNYREATTGEELQEYANWLLEFASEVAPEMQKSETKRRPGHDQLYSLCLSNYLHAVLNLRTCKRFEHAHGKAHEQADILLKFHGNLTPKDPNYHTIRSITELAQTGLDPNTSFDDLKRLEESKRRSLHPVIRYNLACRLLASPHGINSSALFEKALGHLRYALQEPNLKAWATKDPVLARAGIPRQQKTRIDEILRSSAPPGSAPTPTLKLKLKLKAFVKSLR